MTRTTSLLPDETAVELRDAVREAVAATSDWPARIEAAETGRLDGRLWSVLRDQLGVNALAVPEEFGGAGAGWSEVGVVLGELGRAAAAVPYLGAAVTIPALLEAVGADQLLKEAAGGDSVALAVSAAQPPWETDSPFVESNGAVTGRVTSVVDATEASTLLLLVDDAIVAVDMSSPGVQRTVVTSLDMTRPVCDVDIAEAPATRVVDAGGRTAARRARLQTVALLASEQVGLAWACQELSVAYLKERKQFGRLLGSYQALKHRVADVWVDLTQAEAVARHAAVNAGAADDELEITALSAHAYCSEVAVRAAEEMLQLHGGIGFTWEHPAHLLLKRAKANHLMFGTPFVHRARLASVLERL